MANWHMGLNTAAWPALEWGMATIPVMLASAAVVLLTGSTADAQRRPERPPTIEQQASVEVREVRSNLQGHRLTRAIVSVDAYDQMWLTIEKLDIGRRRGVATVLRSQERVSNIYISNWKRSVSLATDSDVFLKEWQRGQLRFLVHNSDGSTYNCLTSKRGQAQWQAECTSNANTTQPSVPQPIAPPIARPPQPIWQNWATDKNVIQACGRTFDGSANESACLDALVRVAYSPAAMISQCERSMDGDENELACVRFAAASLVDPSPIISSCDRAMEGDDNELACAKAAVRARYDITPGITACERAMDGDEFELACIRTIARAQKDMSATVKECERAMNGDESELACVRRAAR